MLLFQKIFQASIGKKIIMALTGILLILFVFGHMVGNLQIFMGSDALNAYAATLQSMGKLVWFIRFGLLAIFVLHILVAINLRMENRAARPISYAKENTIRATITSRTMILSGAVILAFVVYHLLHYTAGIAHSEYFHAKDHLGRHDVYSMVILSFRQIHISAAYILAMLLLAFHLHHAFGSFFQTMGWVKPHTQKTIRSSGIFISVLVFIGYVSIPVAILLRIINLPGGV